jgi:enoyl-CoA hydratase
MSESQTPTYQNLLYDVRNRVAYITLNRPTKTNAMSWALRQELYAALKFAERDHGVGCIVIGGAGKNFCAGYDLSPDVPSPNNPPDGFVGPDFDELTGQYAHNLVNGWWMIWDLLKPVVAMVHGYCLAGGSELASMCDILFVADDATLGYPAVRAISTPDTNYFPWKMGMAQAKYLALTGRSVSGLEAVRIGWAVKAFPAAELQAAVHKEAVAIAGLQPDLVACSKRALNRSYEIMGMRTALNVAADWQGLSNYRKTLQQFFAVSAEKGLKEALLWRDGPFEDYSAKPR